MSRLDQVASRKPRLLGGVKGSYSNNDVFIAGKPRPLVGELHMVCQKCYGEPLRKTLKGYWKLKVGDYRVVFKIAENEVRVLGIIHRKEVYEKIKKRV